MNPAAPVATHDGFPPRDATLRRLTVHADSVRAELVLPALVPLETLMPSILDILCASREYPAGPVAARHRLSAPGGVALDPSKTLAHLGVRDGATLILTRSSRPSAAPRFDDDAHAVAQSLADTQRHWTPPASRLVAVLAAGWLAAICAALLIRAVVGSGQTRAEGVAVAAITSVVSLLAATAAYRASRETAAGLTLGLLACGFAAIAGALVVPGAFGAPNALFSAAASLTFAAVTRGIGCHSTVFTALMCFTAAAAAAALVGCVITIPLPALGAASAAISLVGIEASAPMSLMLAGLAPRLPPQPSAAAQEPALDTDQLRVTASRAHTWLLSMVAAFSAAAALGAIGAALSPRPAGGSCLPGIAFAALTGAVLLSRARSHRNLAMSLPLIVCGTVALSAALVGADVACPLQSVHIAAASMGLAAAALCLGFVDLSARISPLGQRGVELLGYFALAAVVPLACWICGIYTAARGLNLP